MTTKTRLPAFPLVTSDPYISIWSCTDEPAMEDTRHWAGERKRMHMTLTVDGAAYSMLGRQDAPAAPVTDIAVTPTATRYTYTANGVQAEVSFRAPVLMDDLDLLSMPITYIDTDVKAVDGKTHDVQVKFGLHDDLCYDGIVPAAMVGDVYPDSGLTIGYMGKKQQNLLCCSGDHVTIDWGYAYLAAKEGIAFERVDGHWALTSVFAAQAAATGQSHTLLLGYDDVAAINYFGYIAKAWYARNGRSIIDALLYCYHDRANIMARCDALDTQLLDDARAAGGEAYERLAAAAYRQSIGAHKLIADREGNAVFLSKENDSNGCLGTADVSYPSIPLYLLYAPELVRALCRPVLRFASLPAWKADYAPHDVGRYPHATGQVYGLARDAYGRGIVDRNQNRERESFPPLYLYNTDKELYDLRGQMPVEECGNMILMMAAALRADGEDSLIRAYRPLLDKWVEFLVEYGADPGEQLCTDDFAGHMAHNVNLAFKAVSGIAAYAWLLEKLGEGELAKKYSEAARQMADQVYKRSLRGDHTSLTLDADGWSLKYNTIWDILFGFGLLPQSFYDNELAYYVKMRNEYGVPLDSRADYTKSDWILWTAAMTDDKGIVEALCQPIAHYLDETPSRVAFSDWYDTKTGAFCSFINRSVQGGLFMPLLRKRWLADEKG